MNTFPTLAGLGWDIKKRLIFATEVETSKSGKEFRTSFQIGPIYEFDFTYNYLSANDYATLENFYIQQLGPGIPFLLNVPNDSGNPYTVRFKDDTFELNQLMNAIYEQQGFTMRSCG